jgi:8-oxo-dGTP pyrophosphatase MutT (NUDIX family)
VIRYEALDGATVCICAPVRSGQQITDLERRLGLAGASVLAPVPAVGELSPLERARLTALHRRKIEAADVVAVENTGGYVGAGTAGEIAHALSLGKPVQLAEDALELAVDPETYTALVARTAFTEVRPSQLVPANLVRGGIVTVSAPGDGQGRCAWFRVAGVLGFPGRMQTVVALDATRMRVGMDAEDLLAYLDHAYPGEDQRPFTALELEFIAELGTPAHPVPAHRTGPTVSLLARDAGGAVALILGPTGRLELPTRRLAPRRHPLHAAQALAHDLFDGHTPRLRLAGIDTQGPGSDWAGDAHVFACYLDAAGGLAPNVGLTERERVVFTGASQLPARTDPHSARVIAALLAHTETDGGVLLFEEGYRPGERAVWEWHQEQTPPEGVLVTQAGVWAIDLDGRAVLQHRTEAGRFGFPAGSPEPQDGGWLETAAREALEESQVVIDQRAARLIGFQVTYADPGFPNGLAQARYVAPVIGYLPIAPDADPKLGGSRAAYRRYLVDLRHAAALLDWGAHADAQVRAAEQAGLEMGLPVDRPAGDGYRDQGDPGLAEACAAWSAPESACGRGSATTRCPGSLPLGASAHRGRLEGYGV